MASKKTETYELIITEKPSTANKIAHALADGKPVKKSANKVSYYELSHSGRDVVVASAVGHLYSVTEKGEGDRGKYPVYEIEWQLTADVEKGAAFSKKYATLLKKLSKNADEFTVATDYDIEGETIGVNIIKYICKKKDANRMKFSTVTAPDLKEAYENKSRHLDWGQAHAGVTRHELDWLYGINISRALMQSVKTAGSFAVLSAGRVQSPALSIVVAREREIRSFVPEDYWQVFIRGKKSKKDWEAIHESDKFNDEPKADKVVADCKDKEASVAKIESRQFKQQAPNPFDLGSLQSEAYKCFGIKPKETLDHAQNLYSNAHISYPRTSSQKLPTKIGYRKVLQEIAKMDEYKEIANSLLEKSHLSPNEGKKDDPAHPAIYPTGVPPEDLKSREQKIYDLIVKRFFATFGDPATRQTDTVTIRIAKHNFILKGTRTVEKGWHVLYMPYVDLKEEELPEFEKNDDVKYDELEKIEKQTQPPKRFTPSSLISELEKRGLGTKATRADIVENLVRRDYVKGQRSFEVTELGMKIAEILEKRIPEIMDVDLTNQFEEELEQIRDGKKPEEVIDHAHKELDKILTKFKKLEKDTGADLIEAKRIERDIQDTLFQCPVCEHGTLKVKFSPKNKSRFVGCDKYPECEFTATLPGTGMAKASDKECESCGWQMVAMIRKGRGPSASCINPKCPERVKLEKAQEKMAKESGEGEKCPNCDSGTLVMKKGRFGAFLGCDQYPKCKTIRNIPKNKEEKKLQEEMEKKAKKAGAGKQCPNCETGKLKLRKSARGFFLGCDKYPKCKTVVKIPE